MITTTIRIESSVKKNAHELADTIGFSFNDLVNVLLKKAIRDGGVDLTQANVTKTQKTVKTKSTKKPIFKSRLIKKKLIA